MFGISCAIRHYPIKVSLDMDGSVAQALGGFTSTPSLFLIDSSGPIVFAHTCRSDKDRLENLVKKQLGIDPA